MFEISIAALTLGAIVMHSFSISLVTAGVCSILFGLGFFMLFPSRRTILVALIVVTLCFIGALRVWLHTDVSPRQFFGERTVYGRVISTDHRLDSTRFVVRDGLYNKNIQVTQYGKLSILTGDNVSFRGVIERPEDFITDTGRLFQYERYLSSKYIFATTTRVAMSATQPGSTSIGRSADTIRYRSAEYISRYVSFPYDGIVSGMLLGYQGGIPETVNDLFRTTGILHVLVLSGYNITLLVLLLGILLGHVPQTARLVLTTISIVALVIISGGGVASVRAGVMGVIGIMAILSLHKYNPFRALLITYVLFFLYSPLSIFYDPGFHLSFLATFSMIAVLPKIESLFYFLPQTKIINIRELLSLAVCMPVVLLPYTMYFSGTFSLAGLPANILLALVTPVVMALGGLLLLSSAVPSVTVVVGVMLERIISITIHSVEFFSYLPMHNTPAIGPWSVVSIYWLLCAIVFRKEIQSTIVRLQNILLQQTSSSGQ